MTQADGDHITDPKDALQQALSVAVAQYVETMGVPCPVTPKLKFADDDAFWALAEMIKGRPTITVSLSTVATVKTLWTDAFASDFAGLAGHELAATTADMAHLGLVWLMLHELHHFEMGHFELLGRGYLAETDGALRFGAVEREEPKPDPKLDQIDEDPRDDVEPCLELQADHDAMEMLLDAYSKDEWQSLRARATAISAMMILVEREDTKRGAINKSHPKAATRIFQLLDNVWDMPHIPAMVAATQCREPTPEEIPSDEELTSFITEVAVPTILDAITLADIASSTTISADIGAITEFSRDVQTVRVGDTKGLTTTGALQYAALFELNAQLLSLQGLEGLP